MHIPFLHTVRTTVEQHEMLNPPSQGTRVVVALSGGPDSLTLLHVLLALKEEYTLTLSVAHLDHGLRPESKNDVSFVKGVAKSLGLACHAKRVDVAKFCRQRKLSLEEGAREARYAFLEQVAEKAGASKIAVGHTMDDQAETVLMRLIRGAGPLGLAGIPAKRGKIIRPLIGVKRKEVVQFLKKNNIPFLKDPSNLEERFLRNRLRLKLLPLLESEFNPNIVETLARTGQLLEQERVREYGPGPASEVVIIRKGTGKTTKIVLDLSKLLGYNKGLKRETIREAIRIFRGDLRQVGFAHAESVLSLIGGKVGSTAFLPGGIRARKGYREIVFERASKGIKPRPFAVQLKVPGRTECPAGTFVVSSHPVSKAPKAWNRRERNTAWFDAGLVQPPLRVRTRKAGDRFWPLGLLGPKRLKEVLIEDKIPQQDRETLPLVVDQEGILWLAGLRISERAKLRDGTRKVLKVEYIPKTREE
jgi:tRNA(Ile)-lysidine synthase